MIDIQRTLLRYKPNIIHFSGHGSAFNEIILEDEMGRSQPVSNQALSKVFSILSENIRCIVLNACFSESQAEEIAEFVDCVIGMSSAIGDKSAIHFSLAFYQALGFGKDIKTAFELGCAQIQLDGLQDINVPQLISKRGNPQDVVLIKR